MASKYTVCTAHIQYLTLVPPHYFTVRPFHLLMM